MKYKKPEQYSLDFQISYLKLIVYWASLLLLNQDKLVIVIFKIY